MGWKQNGDLTSILTTSSPFQLNSWPHKIPQRSPCNRVPIQMTQRDLAPLLYLDILLPWCFPPLVAGRGRISQAPQKEWVGASTHHHGRLSWSSATKGSEPYFQFSSVKKKHCTKSLLMPILIKPIAFRMPGNMGCWLPGTSSLGGSSCGFRHYPVASVSTLSFTDGAAAATPGFKLTPSCWMCLCKARTATARQSRG